MSAEDMRWLCRKVVQMDNVMRNGQARHKVTCELVWGRWEDEKRHKNGTVSPAQIVGEAYHSLDGPTAEASIQTYCEDLNMRGVLPSKVPEFRKATNKKNDPQQPMLSLMGSDLAKSKPRK